MLEVFRRGLNKFPIASSGADLSVGLQDDGDFYDFGSDGNTHQDEDRRERRMPFAATILELWWVITQPFAVASTNTCTIQTATVSDTFATPADALILTYTDNFTGLVIVSGVQVLAVDGMFVIGLFNSDDATNPAEINTHGIGCASRG